jgi:acetoin utilization deacetylase AcuC-like enzyme
MSADGYARLLKKLSLWSDANCLGRLAVVLEGGYSLEAAEVCSAAVVNAMLGNNWDDMLGPAPYREGEGWRRMVKQAKDLWMT